MVELLNPGRANHVNLNEIFGPTIQGEGPHSGQLVSFVRLAGCNLSCSWCDTPYSWDWERFDKDKESHKVSIEEIADRVRVIGAPRIILTGGEPLLQQRMVPELFHLTGYKIDVETNGTRKPNDDTVAAVDLFNVSTKLSHASDPASLRIVDEAMETFSDLAWVGKAVFKFVCESVADFDEIFELRDRYNLPNHSIWVMPEGYTKARHLKHLEELADPVVEQRWNLTTRIHVLAWETIRER
jgi:7-carboxy-7-deazaguanine synthase